LTVLLEIGFVADVHAEFCKLASQVDLGSPLLTLICIPIMLVFSRYRTCCWRLDNQDPLIISIRVTQLAAVVSGLTPRS
jgi:hypothetical protein